MPIPGCRWTSKKQCSQESETMDLHFPWVKCLRLFYSPSGEKFMIIDAGLVKTSYDQTKIPFWGTFAQFRLYIIGTEKAIPFKDENSENWKTPWKPIYCNKSLQAHPTHTLLVQRLNGFLYIDLLFHNLTKMTRQFRALWLAPPNPLSRWSHCPRVFTSVFPWMLLFYYFFPCLKSPLWFSKEVMGMEFSSESSYFKCLFCVLLYHLDCFYGFLLVVVVVVVVFLGSCCIILASREFFSQPVSPHRHPRRPVQSEPRAHVETLQWAEWQWGICKNSNHPTYQNFWAIGKQ